MSPTFPQGEAISERLCAVTIEEITTIAEILSRAREEISDLVVNPYEDGQPRILVMDTTAKLTEYHDSGIDDFIVRVSASESVTVIHADKNFQRS